VEDVLNPGRCDTLGNLIDNMSQRLASSSCERDGVWYNIPVALSREAHMQTEAHWDKMMQRLRKQVCAHVDQKNTDKNNHWHVDLFPASKKFVVYHVLKVQDELRGKLMKLDAVNNRDYDEHNELDAGLPMADPIYHMYIECRKNPRTEEENGTVAGRNMQFMDVMYNRWAVQNTSMLRKRILERKAEELLLKNTATGESGEENEKRGGDMTRRAISASRMVENSKYKNTSNPRLCST
jgi:hypothetical protein